MQVKESFETKVNAAAIRTYLSHFYRSQDYRLQEDENSLTAVPYSFTNPFLNWSKAVKHNSLVYQFKTEEHKTVIQFIYRVSAVDKMVSLVIPFFIFLALYLMVKANLSSINPLDALLVLAFSGAVVGYSLFQLKNLSRHVVAKNKKLLEDLELFADKHLHKGLLNESFKEM